MESLQIEIVRELKLRLLNDFSSRLLYLETWPNMFRTSVEIYKQILERKGPTLPSEFKEPRVAIPLLINVLEQILSTDSSALKMSDETKTLLQYILKTSAISVFQTFYDDDMSDTSVPKGIRISDLKFSDDLSLAVFDFLRKRVNLFTINVNNWPILISYAVEFLKDYSPAINIDRQRKILDEVLPRVLEALSASSSTTETKEQEKYIQKCLKPLIDSMYDTPSPLDHQRRDQATAHIKTGKAKCCIIM
jgi:hypothetical protein